jgi:hypothetical protein
LGFSEGAAVGAGVEKKLGVGVVAVVIDGIAAEGAAAGADITGAGDLAETTGAGAVGPLMEVLDSFSAGFSPGLGNAIVEVKAGDDMVVGGVTAASFFFFASSNLPRIFLIVAASSSCFSHFE